LACLDKFNNYEVLVKIKSPQIEPNPARLSLAMLLIVTELLRQKSLSGQGLGGFEVD
jgi:hypothetical protein